MNKMKKIGLTALAASLVSVSAQAVDISGGQSLTYSNGNDGVQGNPWSMNDSLTFSWGGELDNGFTVDVSFLLDNSDGNAGQIFDNRSLAIGMGDAGTLTFWGQAGSGVVGSFDDKTPNAYEESWAVAAYTATNDTGATDLINGNAQGNLQPRQPEDDLVLGVHGVDDLAAQRGENGSTDVRARFLSFDGVRGISIGTKSVLEAQDLCEKETSWL